MKDRKGTKDKSITGNAVTDSAFLRLSHVLKEIAESTVNGKKEEAAEGKSDTRAPHLRSS